MLYVGMGCIMIPVPFVCNATACSGDTFVDASDVKIIY